jgi:hypothetical protein
VLKFLRSLAVLSLVATSSYAVRPPIENPPLCFDLPTCTFSDQSNWYLSHPCILMQGGQTSYVYINQVTGAWCLFGPIMP